MDERMEKVLETLTEIQIDIAEIRKDLNFQALSLEEYNSHLETHIKRSEHLEKLVDELYKYKYYVSGGIAVAIPVVIFFLEGIKAWILK